MTAKRIIILILFFVSLNSLSSQTINPILNAKVIYIGDVWYIEYKDTKVIYMIHEVLVYASDDNFYTKTVITPLDKNLNSTAKPPCLTCTFNIESKDKNSWHLYSPVSGDLSDDLYTAYKFYQYYLCR